MRGWHVQKLGVKGLSGQSVRKFAITGQAGHGKDTISNIIRDHTDQRIYALATPVKHICSYLTNTNICTLAKEKPYTFRYDFDLEMLYKHYKFDDYVDFHSAIYALKVLLYEKEYITPRELFQIVGTEWGRNYIDEDAWVDLVPDESGIISDLRFNNEAIYLKNKGYTIIKVIRHVNGTKFYDHASELGILKKYVDVTIMNNGTVDLLEEKVLSYLEA